MRILLENGADVNAVNQWDRTPLACVKKANILRVLLSYRPDMSIYRLNANDRKKFDIMINAYEEDNRSDIFNPAVLHGIVKAGDLEKTIYYMERGADYKYVDVEGRNSLHHAVENGHYEIVRFIVEENISENSEPIYNDVHLVDVKTNEMDVYESLKFRTDHKAISAFINSKDINGVTPVDLATKNTYTKIANYLLEMEAEKNE